MGNKGLKKRNKLNSDRELYFMIAPALIYFFIFAYLPLVGLVIAFKNYNFTDGVIFSPWCGIENFRFFFESGQAWSITRNTVVYNIVFLATATIFEIILAIFLSEVAGNKIKKFCQSVMILPYFISMVVVAIFLYNMLNYENGIINRLLAKFGAEPIQFYSEVGLWKYILTFVNLWKGAGYGCIVYLAAITGLDAEIYEAAEIDGANIWSRIRYITLPLLVPTIVTLSLLSLGRVLRGNFDLFYQLIGNNGVLYESTDIIDTFVFRSLLSSSNIGMSSAACFFQSVVCFVFIVLVNKGVKLYNKDYALF